MCIFATLFGVLPDCPLLILTNREEFRERPANPPQLFDDEAGRPAWFGPSDLKAGGTWLGINRFGLIVVLTNRPIPTGDENGRSRGLLCRDLLRCPSTDDAVEEVHRQRQQHNFAGFNVLMLTRDRCAVVEAGESIDTVLLSTGIHCIANANLNDPTDARIERIRNELETMKEGNDCIETLVSTSKRICSLTAERDEEAICRIGGNWGTVSSTIIAIGHRPTDIVFAYAAGPPSQVDYKDYSSTARLLFQRN